MHSLGNLVLICLDEILCHVPHQEDIDIDLSDLDLWKSAIRKLRSASARGSDGISAQELKLLPECAIAALARIFAQDGFQFDQHFVVGLVAPLSKAGLQIPSRDKTRPITILPQLYRLWSSVVSQQIAASLNKWAPRQITGFLPGRGSVQAALSAQFDLEEARATGAFLTGLVLDFTKCFNNISWIFGFFALRACGVPISILEVWIAAQRSLRRFWLLSGELFFVGLPSGGFPEGDQFSVLVMLAVSIAWIFYLQGSGVLSPRLSLTCYADNWSWTTGCPSDHAHLLDLTLNFVRLVGVSVDFHKTWWWASSTIHDQLISQIFAEKTNGRLVKVNSASDLGFQMLYSSRN